MTTRVKMVIVTAALAIASLTMGCSSDDASTAKPSSSSSSGSSGSSAGLSLAFTSKCARCHGSTGTGDATYPSLPGTLTLPTFITTVRSGRRAMPMFGASEISDADLAADYDWMKTKR